MVWLQSGGKLISASLFHCSFYFDQMGYLWRILPFIVGKFSSICFLLLILWFLYYSSEGKAGIQ